MPRLSLDLTFSRKPSLITKVTEAGCHLFLEYAPISSKRLSHLWYLLHYMLLEGKVFVLFFQVSIQLRLGS